jgi:hypothetical protein
MPFVHLKRFERERAEAEAARLEAEKRRELRRAVREVIPRSVRVPKRPRGRTPPGGVGKREVAELRVKAAKYLDGEGGLRALEAEVQHTALVILMIDGVLGTEPWRAAGGPHGGLIAANARLRYLENAARLLADLRQARGGAEPKLLDGVIDAEPAEGTPA